MAPPVSSIRRRPRGDVSSAIMVLAESYSRVETTRPRAVLILGSCSASHGAGCSSADSLVWNDGTKERKPASRGSNVAKGEGMAMRMAIASPLAKAVMKRSLPLNHCQRKAMVPISMETKMEMMRKNPPVPASPPERRISVARMRMTSPGARPNRERVFLWVGMDAVFIAV